MKAFSLFILSFLLVVGTAFADVSAYRKEGTDFTYYVKRFKEEKDSFNLLKKTPLNSAVLFPFSSLPKVTPWISAQAMQERFQQIRDSRFVPTKNGILRRISWLYPDDGCFARAALFNRNAFQMFIPIPEKIFVFGNLRVDTSNSPRKRVGWWYHTAPIVEVNGEKYVLDPSIEISRPLPLIEWMRRMGNPDKMKIAICESGTYSPGDDCSKESDGLETRAMSSQQKYLNLEWNRLRSLGIEPEVALGDNPPW